MHVRAQCNGIFNTLDWNHFFCISQLKEEIHFEFNCFFYRNKEESNMQIKKKIRS